MISSASVLATWRSSLRIGLNLLLHGERHVTRSPNDWGHPSALSGQDRAQGPHT